MQGQTLALCFQSVAELWLWPESRKWSKSNREGLDRFIRKFLIIPYHYELAQVWAKVMYASKTQGMKFEAGDCWIAATAVHYDIPLLVHDKDFSRPSIPGLNVITYF
jgi:tRNA(fMet)-specific endonuclease VapC